LGTGVATWLATPSGANLAAALTTALPASKGGTGVDGSAAANGTLLIGNGSGYTLATLTQGSGVTITNGAGSITIAATGAPVVARVSTQVDRNATTTKTNITGLSWTLSGSTTYSFVIYLILTSGAGGSEYDFNGGTATATTFNATSCSTTSNNASVFSLNTTALNTALFTGGATCTFTVLQGTITVNAGGTFIPRFSQNTASGTTSVLVGSWGFMVANP
jgi:hypothetical protein